MNNPGRGDNSESRWKLVYLAVAVNTVAVYLLLWWFSKAFV